MKRRSSSEEGCGLSSVSAVKILERAAAARLLQRERGEDAQADRAIGRRSGEQRVGDVVGLAESERQRQHDRLADARHDGVGQAIGGIELRRRVSPKTHA